MRIRNNLWMMNEGNKEWIMNEWAEERMNKGWMRGKKEPIKDEWA